MKKLVFIAFILSLGAFAQDSEFSGQITWSELFPVGKKVLSPDIIGQDGQSIYLSRFIKGDRYIEKYNLSTLKLEKSVEANLTYNEKDLTLSNQFMFGGQPTFLTSFYNKKTKINYTFLQTINPSTLEVSAPKKISEQYIELKFGMLGFGGASGFSRSENGDFGFVMASDVNEATTDEQLSSGGYSIKGYLITGDGNLEAETSFKYPIDNFLMSQLKVSNDGEVYMLGFKLIPNTDGRKKVFGGQSMKIGSTHMLVLDVKTGEIASFDIDLGDREVEQITFAFAPEGGVNIGGLSSTDGKGVTGSFYLKLDAEFNQTSQEITDFEDDFITTSWSEKKKEDLEKKQDKGKDVQPEFFNYDINYLVTKPDGSSLMLAEQYYVRVVTRTTSNGNGGTTTTTTYYYYYNDIIAVNYDSKGEFLWKTVITKRQVSVNDYGYYSSYFIVPDGNDVHIIYNDRESNYVDTEGMSSSEIKALSRTTIGAKVTLTAEGEVSKQKLFEFEEGGLRLVPKVCGAAGTNYVFLYARGRVGDKVGVIEMD